MAAEIVVTGLLFPATQVPSADVNMLDDYEEGTFVSLVTTGGGTAPLNASFDTLQYTKIGRKVHVHGALTLGTVSAPTGAVNIALPFTAGGGTEFSGFAAASVMVNSMAAGWTGVPVGYVSPSSAVLALFEFAAGVSANPGTKLATGGTIYISVTYSV